jgi:co-chaperonin GroES (HSP10)
MKLVPGPERVLVEFKEGKTQSAGGIHLPDSVKETEIFEARVIETERFHDKEYKFKPEDHILFRRDGAAEIEVRGTKYFLVHEANIIVVIRSSKELPEVPEPPPGPPPLETE